MRKAERRGFEEVFRAYYASVLRTAYVVLHDHGRAEEVTQEAFLRLYQRWSTASAYDHPAAWVRTVAVRDAIRRAERESRQVVTLSVVDHGASDRLPDLDLFQAVAALPPRQRAAVALHYLEDRPVDEIALLMEVSPTTVRQHLFQARARLGVILTDRTEEGERHAR
ncbi:RNA polymerase sigma factor [Nocardioides sp. MAHUQ-72]|uniref:RNA polymerase sigma factor n=1 Tax=unclassified Nocardioides TaxID=2615069 RepID=UPI00360FED78